MTEASQVSAAAGLTGEGGTARQRRGEWLQRRGPGVRCSKDDDKVKSEQYPLIRSNDRERPGPDSRRTHSETVNQKPPHEAASLRETVAYRHDVKCPSPFATLTGRTLSSDSEVLLNAQKRASLSFSHHRWIQR